MAREINGRTWYDHAIAFADMKWPRASAKHRKSIAEALATATPALMIIGRAAPSKATVQAALYGWAFNKARREGGPLPGDLAPAIRWLEGNTVPLAALGDAALVRKTLDGLALPATIPVGPRAL